MKIHLISHTTEPLKSIAAAILNIGIGRDIKSLNEITREEAEKAFKDTISSWLTSPLEYASFNFFWEDIPLFMRTELERARIGWSYAERSLRFYKAEERNPIDKIDWKMFPSADNHRALFLEMANSHMIHYQKLKEAGMDNQEARNAIGVWFGTALQTSCNFRALRDTMAVRLSSQAHPSWKEATKQIKELVTQVDSVLGEALVDVCKLNGRCVWQSKLDRQCPDCINRGWGVNHIHDFSKGQCTCGEIQK